MFNAQLTALALGSFWIAVSDDSSHWDKAILLPSHVAARSALILAAFIGLAITQAG